MATKSAFNMCSNFLILLLFLIVAQLNQFTVASYSMREEFDKIDLGHASVPAYCRHINYFNNLGYQDCCSKEVYGDACELCVKYFFYPSELETLGNETARIDKIFNIEYYAHSMNFLLMQAYTDRLTTDLFKNKQCPRFENVPPEPSFIDLYLNSDSMDEFYQNFLKLSERVNYTQTAIPEHCIDKDLLHLLIYSTQGSKALFQLYHVMLYGVKECRTSLSELLVGSFLKINELADYQSLTLSKNSSSVKRLDADTTTADSELQNLDVIVNATIDKNSGTTSGTYLPGYKAWLATSISIAIISLTSVAMVGIIIFKKNSTVYKYMIQFFLAMAVGALVSDSLVHLLPEAMGTHSHNHEEHNHLPSRLETVSNKDINQDHTNERLQIPSSDIFDNRQAIESKSEILEHSHEHIADNQELNHEHTVDNIEHNNDHTDGSLKHSHEHPDKFDANFFIWKGLVVILAIYFFYGVEFIIFVAPKWFGHNRQKSCHSHCHNGLNSSEKKSESADDSKQPFTGYCNHNHFDQHTSVGLIEPQLLEHYEAEHNQEPTSENISFVKSLKEKVKSYFTVDKLVWMVTIGDGFHNIIDGIAIGNNFAMPWPAGFTSGIMTSVAIIAHEIPHEIGDNAAMLASGLSIKKTIMFNFVSSLTCFIGGFIGVGITQIDSGAYGPWVSSIVCGMFLYISLTLILPCLTKELEHSKKPGYLFLLHTLGFAVGVGSLVVLAFYEDKILSVFA